MNVTCDDCLGSVGHSASLHTLKLDSHTGFLDLSLGTLLRILKVTLVTEFHQVTRLVDLTLEATQGALDGLTIADIDLNLDRQLGGRANAYFPTSESGMEQRR